MIFDKFAKITEKKVLPCHEEDFRILDKLKLFQFEEISYKVLPKKIDEDYQDNFFLPFPIVGIEDSASLVILIDNVTDGLGLNVKRTYIEVVSTHSGDEGFTTYTADEETLSQRKERVETLCISRGIIHNIILEENMFHANSTLSDVVYIQNDAVHPFSEKIVKENAQTLIKEAPKNALVALQQVAYMNSDNFFILENRLQKERKKRKGKIVRSNDRITYTMLRPKDIRERLNLTNVGQKRLSPRPHDRRAHMRTIHRGNKEKERRVHVKASWVGPSSATIGKRIYRVLLDR